MFVSSVASLKKWPYYNRNNYNYRRNKPAFIPNINRFSQNTTRFLQNTSPYLIDFTKKLDSSNSFASLPKIDHVVNALDNPLLSRPKIGDGNKKFIRFSTRNRNSNSKKNNAPNENFITLLLFGSATFFAGWILCIARRKMTVALSTLALSTGLLRNPRIIL
jgi:hypothetical protein